MYQLLISTPQEWVDEVIANFDTFLLDHAAAEKKASSMAMSLISHYPDRQKLVTTMADLAVEELTHFKEVVKIIQSRGLKLGSDSKDEYIVKFRSCIRDGKEAYLLDRLLIASIVEARGHERFGLIAEALPEGKLKKFYLAITASESRHYIVFINLATLYSDEKIVRTRLDELLKFEADIVAKLPIKAALH